MHIESTDPSELAEDSGETGDQAAVDLLIKRAEQAEQQQEEEPEQQEAAEEGEDALEQAEETEAEDDDPEIDLGDIKLKKSELKAGYMKDADYRQKTAATAERQRQLQAREEQIQQERTQYANQLDVFLQTMHSELVGDQAALAELARTDPAEWVAQNAAFQQRAQKFNEALQHRQAIAGRMTADEERQQADWRKAERDKLHEKLPQWRDPAKASAEQKLVAEYLIEQGYSQEDLKELFDHRALLVAREAALYRQSQAAKQSVKDKQVKTEPNKPVKPGAAHQKTTDQSVAKIDQLRARAKRTGSQEDIAAYLVAK